MYIEECIAKPTTFKVIHITNDLGEQIKADFLRLEDVSMEEGYRKRRHALVNKYHGLPFSDTFGYCFMANYGTDNQRRMQMVSLDDRLIEEVSGEQYLISENQYYRYFEPKSHAKIVGQHLRDAVESMAKPDASNN